MDWHYRMNLIEARFSFQYNCTLFKYDYIYYQMHINIVSGNDMHDSSTLLWDSMLF